MDPKVKHFSMLRSFSLPDAVTLLNGFLGMAAVLSCMHFLVSKQLDDLWRAFYCLPFALVADFADGRIARWRNKQSLLGQELDSLADLVSFGVAPAAVAFACGMQGAWDALVLMYFVCCGIGRLARYNTTAASLSDGSGKVKYFEGTPIPTSLSLVLVLGVLTSRGLIGDALPWGIVRIWGYELHPLVGLYALSGSLMISKTLRIPKP